MISVRKIPNLFPSAVESVPYRIAFIGEAPNKEENQIGQAFVGRSAEFLRTLLKEAGIDWKTCFFGNVCQIKPPYYDLDNFNWTGFEIQDGLDQLRADMTAFDPTLVVLLGSTALRAAKGTYQDKKGRYKQFSIFDWRGSVFECNLQGSPFFGRKCLAAFHPSQLGRIYSYLPLARQDFRKARLHGTFKEVPAHGLVLDVCPKVDTICARLKAIREHSIPISVDIEGYVDAMTCISISPSEKQAFIVPFRNQQGEHYWSLDDEVKIWYELSRTLAASNVLKTLQNAMYDAFVLAYSYKVCLSPVKEDIMLKTWELYCEYPLDLGFQTSLYTNHPYYKAMGKVPNEQVNWEYCCMDSAITNEICGRQTKLLKDEKHYRFNVSLIPPFLYIELKGQLVDAKKRRDRINELNAQAYFDNDKKISSGYEQLKLETMVGWQINVNSPDDMQKLLYEQLKHEVQYKIRADGGRTPTADYEALLTLAFKSGGDETLMQCIKVRQIRKRCSAIEGLTTDPDGRIRSSTKIPGSDTGRTSQSKAPTGKGTNLQTVSKPDRDLIIADPDHDYNQNDLAGADGWTVAAHCAYYGDPVMLEDYLFGLKPAKTLALSVKYGDKVLGLDRKELKAMSKDINSETDPDNHYLYFISKCCQHGTNYGMMPGLLALTVFLQSEGAIHISTETAATYQNRYLSRYRGVKLWHAGAKFKLETTGQLTAASGHTRVFLDRRKDKSTLNAYLSSEPQGNTTYVTNLALIKLWNDPTNRTPSGGLRVQPIHQVHDALNNQWHMRDREYGREGVRRWFNNKIVIAGIEITIPFEGQYGPSWGSTPYPL